MGWFYKPKSSAIKRREGERMKTVAPTVEYVPKPNLKKQVVSKAIDKGYNCYLSNDSVVMFQNETDTDEIVEWLKANFGEEHEVNKKNVVSLPFSYGFTYTS